MLNSFTASMPIIASNSEFSKVTLSSDLTDFEIILVDANLHEVELLNPMYITINITDASVSMTLEDIERYEFSRKTNKELVRTMYKALNKEVQHDVDQLMVPYI